MSSHRPYNYHHRHAPLTNSNTNNNVKKSSSSSTSSSMKANGRLPILPSKFQEKPRLTKPIGPPPVPTWERSQPSPSLQRRISSHSNVGQQRSSSPSTHRRISSHSNVGQQRPGANSPSTQRHVSSFSSERQSRPGAISPSIQRHISSNSNKRQSRSGAMSPSIQKQVQRSPITGSPTQSFPQEDEKDYFATLLATQRRKERTVPRPPDTDPTHRHDHYASYSSRTSVGVAHGTAQSVSPSAMRSPGHHHHHHRRSPSADLPSYTYPSHLTSFTPPWADEAELLSSSKPRERRLDRKRIESPSHVTQHRRSGSFHYSPSTSSEGSVRWSGSLSNLSDSRHTTSSYIVEKHTGERLESRYSPENTGSKKSIAGALDSGHHSSMYYSSGSAARDRSVTTASPPDPATSRTKVASRTLTQHSEDTSLKLGVGTSSSQRREEKPSGKASGVDLHGVAPVKTGSQQSLEAIMSVSTSGGGIVGLCNLGNTCFMNSILQCLSHTVELTNLFLCNNYTSKMCSAYRKAMRDIWLYQENSGYPSGLPTSLHYKSRRPLNVLHLKNAISSQRYEYYGSSQHDAQEFMTCLVTTLHNELLKPAGKIPPIKSEKDLSDLELGQIRWEYQQSIDSSPISSIFMGQFKSVIKCKVCGCTSRVFEPFWDIGLPLCKKTPMNLDDCFSLFTKKETLDDDNKPICTQCRKPQTSYKQMTIQRFPRILILYLKRFFMGHGARHKLQSPVTVPMSVDLSQFASPEAVKGKKAHYELYGIVNHTGSLDFGHYTADIKHFGLQKWYHCNDASVYGHSDSSSLAVGRPLTSEAVYVLFYRQRERDSSP